MDTERVTLDFTHADEFHRSLGAVDAAQARAWFDGVDWDDEARTATRTHFFPTLALSFGDDGRVGQLLVVGGEPDRWTVFGSTKQARKLMGFIPWPERATVYEVEVDADVVREILEAACLSHAARFRAFRNRAWRGRGIGLSG